MMPSALQRHLEVLWEVFIAARARNHWPPNWRHYVASLGHTDAL